MNNIINITKTYLPDINKFKSYINKIYKSGWVTNNGKLVQELKERLEDYLGIKNLLLVSNGTMALQIAYKVMDIKTEAITTPFSFVATVNSLIWEGITPIFADIDKNTLFIDPIEVRSKIKPSTEAIVATHIFGNACDIKQLEEISKDYKIKLIFDASHCFGIKYKGRSILSFGNISTISFHAIKIFHTIEGGGIVFKSSDDYENAKLMINFGFEELYKISSVGINAKMNEFEAAMGLCVLDDIDLILENRAERWFFYERELKDYVNIQKWNNECSNNYSFFPILLKNSTTVTKIINELNKYNIFPRRYFYPSLDTLNYIQPKQYTPVSRHISERILCLPLYFGLNKKTQKKIIDIVKSNL